MECAKQGYWSWEYWESKLGGVSGNNSYTNFAKRQYHKARRRHDEKIIISQLLDYHYPCRKTLGYPDVEHGNITEWQEHNHRVQLKEVA